MSYGLAIIHPGIQLIKQFINFGQSKSI